MLLAKAKKLLKDEYLKNYAMADEFGRFFMDEKISHSYQVLGAGTYILNREESFIHCSDEELDKLRATLLLHDVGRFYEALVRSNGVNVDHGIYGAEILAKTEEFCRLDIVLPVKHHGHLLNFLLEDEIYKKLSVKEKREIDRIISMVTDADKVANFYLLARAHNDMENLFFPTSYDGVRSKVVSPEVLKSYMNHTLVKSTDVKNWADRALMVMACVYDLHYKSSFDFMEKLNVIPRVIAWIRKYWEENEAEIYISELNNYIRKRLENFEPFTYF